MIGAVCDASVAAGWLLPDEAPAGRFALLRDGRLGPVAVPWLFWFEIRSVLLVNERRGRLTPAQTSACLDALDDLALEVDGEPRGTHLLTLARRHRLSAYDAAYLELSIRRRMALATFDRALATAALAESVVLVPTTPS